MSPSLISLSSSVPWALASLFSFLARYALQLEYAELVGRDTLVDELFELLRGDS